MVPSAPITGEEYGKTLRTEEVNNPVNCCKRNGNDSEPDNGQNSTKIHHHNWMVLVLKYEHILLHRIWISHFWMSLLFRLLEGKFTVTSFLS